MTKTDRFTTLSFESGAAGRGGVASGLWAPVAWLFGALAAGVAVALGAVLAVFTAVAVAVFALAAGVLVFLSGLALKARGPRKARPAGDGVIEARKEGDTWVAYGWERPGG